MKVVLPHRDVLERLDISFCWIRSVLPAVSRSVGEMWLRSITGATLVAVRRAGKLLQNLGPDHRSETDDTAILIGDQSQVLRPCAFSIRTWHKIRHTSMARLQKALPKCGSSWRMAA